MNKAKLSKFHTDNILQAADRLFLKHGFEKTAVETIAAEADYSKPTVYAYFRSKEEIFAKNLLIHLTKFRDDLIRVANENLPFEGAYLSVCRTALRFKRERGVYYRGLVGALDYGVNSLSASAEIRALSAEVNRFLTGLLKSAAGRGDVRLTAEPARAYAYLWSAVNGIIASPLTDPRRFLSEAEYENFLTECFLNLIAPYRTAAQNEETIYKKGVAL